MKPSIEIKKKDLPSEFIYKNKTITDAIEIANSFNEYFANIGPTIAITHLYIISIQIAIMLIVKPCLHITMK